MTKRTVTIIGTIILSLLLTLGIGYIFSLYHFGDSIMPRTLAYLSSIFSIIEYVILSIVYIISKKIKKEKIGFRKIAGLTIIFIALLLIIDFVITLDVDWLNHYMYSSPFYITVITRIIEYLVLSIILIITGIVILKKEKKQSNISNHK